MVELNNKTRSKVPAGRLIAAAEKLMAFGRLKNKELSIAIVGDKRMRELNKLYRKKDGTTDVLSFKGEGRELGEVIISFNQIKKQAKALKKPLEKELIFILVHGFLHLIGMDDKTEVDRIKMIKKGEYLMKKLCLI